MQELHMPDGKSVAINPEQIAYLHALGDQATLIGFGGGATLAVQGSYDDVLVQLGLLDHAGGDDDADGNNDGDGDDIDDLGEADEEAEELVNSHAEEHALQARPRF